jgi:hypothetical protein
MADITAMTIATFAIRLNILITLLTAGIHHLQSLTAPGAQTASPLGSCQVSVLIRETLQKQKGHNRKTLPLWPLFSVR